MPTQTERAADSARGTELLSPAALVSLPDDRRTFDERAGLSFSHEYCWAAFFFFFCVGRLERFGVLPAEVYITFSIYALANVVTGIFLENARSSGKKDREHVIQEELTLKNHYLHDIQMVFEEAWPEWDSCRDGRRSKAFQAEYGLA